ncbi:MAG: carbohydrate ABC transporter permease [Thermodesulfobacteriota bacterium]
MSWRISRKLELRRLIIIYLLVALFLAFTLPPLVIPFFTSFKTMSDVYALPPKLLPTPFTIESYIYSLKEKNFLDNLYHSAVVATVVTFLTLVFAVSSGYGLARFNFRGRRLLAMSVLLAYLLPAVALLVPFFVIFKNLGLIDTYPAIILAHLVLTVPFAIWFMRGYLTYIPWELEEAAMVDGCSRPGAILRVIFPLLKPAVLAIGFFSFITSWQEFVYALIFTGINTATAPVVIASFVQEAYVDWGGLAASTMIFSAPVAVLFLLFQRYLISGLMGGAVKG